MDQAELNAMHDALIVMPPAYDPAAGLLRGLEDRRVLMVARNADTAEQIETALIGYGVEVVRITSDEDRGIHADRLVRTGPPRLKTGCVYLTDVSSWSSSLVAMRVTKTVEAMTAAIEACAGGSAGDIVLQVMPGDEPYGSSDVFNLLTDGIVTADMRRSGVESHGPTTLDLSDMPVHRREAYEESTMDRLFGDDVLKRERQARMTIVCVDRDYDLSVCRIDLPDAGFDYRAVNEAFNRRGPRGNRGDRRVNRGGRGRR